MMNVVLLVLCVVVARSAVPKVEVLRVLDGSELVVRVQPCGGWTRIFPLAHAILLDVKSEEHEELVVEEQDGVATRVVGVQPFVATFRIASDLAALWRDDAIWMDAPRCASSGVQVPRLLCKIVVLRSATCFGSADAKVTVETAHGVGALVVEWENAEPSRGGDLARVRVSDSVGRWCEDEIVVPPTMSLQASIEVAHVRCFGGGDGIMNLTVLGGTPPYRFVWSGGGCTDEDVSATAGDFSVDVFDANECHVVGRATVTQPPLLEASLSVVGSKSLEVRVRGGTAPFMIVWPGNSESENSTVLASVLPGRHFVVLRDANGCVANASAIVAAGLACPQLDMCLLEKDPTLCLRTLGASSLWRESPSSCCHVLAVMSLVRWLRTRALCDGTEDFGGEFLALALGEVLVLSPVQCLDLVVTFESAVLPSLPLWIRSLHVEMAENFTRFHKTVLDRLVFGEAWEPQPNPPNVLTVGPFGFDNEPIIAPSLALPTKIARVVVLVLKAYSFPTSSVSFAYFPWTLQSDVVLAALFVRSVARLTRADWIVPTDSAGILVIGKMAAEMFAHPVVERDWYIRDALQRSLPWPVVYPPPHLSKLIAGHGRFAPREALVSDSDELHYPQGPDAARVEEAWRLVGPFSYAKREYSEASRGVAQDDAGTLESALKAVQRVFPRGAGVSAMDLELKVAIFFQADIRLDSGVMPIGVRFFARAGKILAAHVSEAVESNVVYVTVRDALVEKRTAEFVQAINFTGFGAAWWWRKDGKAFLTDFNARLERHACLTSVLNGADLLGDPCYALQTGLVEDDMYQSSGPHFVRAGVRYMDPVRAMSSAAPRMTQLLRDEKTIPWNLHAKDEKLFRHVQWKIGQLVK